MNGWTLTDVQSLEQEEYNELVIWIEETIQRAKDGTDEESIDADEIAASLESRDHEDDGG